MPVGIIKYKTGNSVVPGHVPIGAGDLISASALAATPTIAEFQQPGTSFSVERLFSRTRHLCHEALGSEMIMEVRLTKMWIISYLKVHEQLRVAQYISVFKN